MQTLKSLNSASATLAEIEVAHMIRKGQFDHSEQSGFAQRSGISRNVAAEDLRRGDFSTLQPPANPARITTA
jgi:hypothetical protein